MAFKIDDCPLIGRWQIVESDLWKPGRYGPAHMIIRNDNRGLIEIDAFEASLDVSYSETMAFFEWWGSDDGHEVLGDGHAALNADGSAEITLIFRHGEDEMILKAIREGRTTRR